jgi:hypothetical protein
VASQAELLGQGAFAEIRRLVKMPKGISQVPNEGLAHDTLKFWPHSVRLAAAFSLARSYDDDSDGCVGRQG